MTMPIIIKKFTFTLLVFFHASLCSMSCEEYLNHVNTLEQPITHINAIMRKYHQYERPHSKDETKKDILALQAICAASASLTSEQQKTITDEILGLSLFILFFAHPFNQTSAYIDAILSAIKPTAAYLAVPPSFDAHVRECDFCNMVTANWNTLAPHEQLVIKQIAAIPNASFYFAIPFSLTPSKLIRRLIIFLFFHTRHMPHINDRFQSLSTFKTIMQSYTLYYPGVKNTNPWRFFYKQLEQDPRLDYIVVDDLQSLCNASKNHLQFYDSSNQQSYYTHVANSVAQAYTAQELAISTSHLNHLIAAAYLGAEKVFTEFFDRYAPLLFDNQKLFYAAHLGGNASIKSMVQGIFDKETIAPWYTESFYAQACRADNSVLAQYIKAYSWSNKISPFYQESLNQNAPLIIDKFLVHAMDEFTHTMKHPKASLFANDKTNQVINAQLTDWAILAQSTLPKITGIQNELSFIHFLQTNTPQLTQALTYIHKKIPFNNRAHTLSKNNVSASEYDKQVIKNINAFFTNHANNAQATSYILDTLIGILIHDIFFITPYAIIQEYVNTIITSIPRLKAASSLTTPSTKAYCNKMHKSLETLQPYDALIINTLSPESINLLKYPLHAIILATKLSLCKHAPLPFYTLYEFKKFIQQLEITTLSPESSQNPFAYKNNIDSNVALEYELIFDLLSIPKKEYETTLKLHEKLNNLHKTHYMSHAFFAGLIGDYNYFKTIYKKSSLNNKLTSIVAAIYGGNQECINLSMQSFNEGNLPSPEINESIFNAIFTNNNYILFREINTKNPLFQGITSSLPNQAIFCYKYLSILKKNYYVSDNLALNNHFFYAQKTRAYHVMAAIMKYSKKHNLTKKLIPTPTTSLTNLHAAIIAQDQQMIDHILQTTPQKNLLKLFEDTLESVTVKDHTFKCIHSACSCGNLDLVKKIINQNTFYTECHSFFITLLFLALLNEQTNILEFLLTYNKLHVKHILLIDDLFDIKRPHIFLIAHHLFKKLVQNNRKKILKLLIQYKLCTTSKNPSLISNSVLYILLKEAMSCKPLFISLLKKTQKTYPNINWLSERIPLDYLYPRHSISNQLTLMDLALEYEKNELFDWFLIEKKCQPTINTLSIIVNQGKYDLLQRLAPDYTAAEYFDTIYDDPVKTCLTDQNFHALTILCDAFAMQTHNKNVPILESLVKNMKVTNNTSSTTIITKKDESIKEAILFLLEKTQDRYITSMPGKKNIFHTIAITPLSSENLDFLLHTITRFLPIKKIQHMIHSNNSNEIKSPLIHAIEQNNTMFLDKILQIVPCNINQTYAQYNGDTLLHIAVKKHAYTCIEILMKHGGTTTIPNNQGLTVLNVLQTITHGLPLECLHIQDSIKSVEKRIDTLKGGYKKECSIHLATLKDKLQSKEAKIERLKTIFQYIPEQKTTQSVLTDSFKLALKNHDKKMLINIIQQGIDLFHNYIDDKPLLFALCNANWDQRILTLLCSMYNPTALLHVKDTHKKTFIKYISHAQDTTLLNAFLSACPTPKDPDLENVLYKTLLWTIKHGLLPVVSYLLTQEIIPIDCDQSKNFEENTILHHAILHKQHDVAMYLVTHKRFDLHLFNKNGMNPFMLAIAHQDIALAEHIKNEYFKIFHSDPLYNHINNLITTVKTQSIPLVRYYLENMPPNTVDINEMPFGMPKNALFLAVENNNLEMARLLVAHGADANIKNRNQGKVPLFVAIEKNNQELINLLIKITDPRNTDKDGNSIAHFAVKHKNIDVLKTLHENYIPFTQLNNRHQTPLQMALQLPQSKKKQNIVTFLQNH